MELNWVEVELMWHSFQQVTETAIKSNGLAANKRRKESAMNKSAGLRRRGFFQSEKKERHRNKPKERIGSICSFVDDEFEFEFSLLLFRLELCPLIRSGPLSSGRNWPLPAVIIRAISCCIFHTCAISYLRVIFRYFKVSSFNFGSFFIVKSTFTFRWILADFLGDFWVIFG